MYIYILVINPIFQPELVDRGYEPRSSQTKDYKIGIYCFSTN